MDQKLVNILAEVFQIKESEIQESLKKEDVGSWDSLKQMDLVVTLESEYGISLEIPDILKMQSVGTIINVLTEKGIKFED